MEHRIVWPSGSARATSAAPIEPKAPDLTGCIWNQTLTTPNDGSLRLAAQEGRDVQNLFLDRVADGRGAAERIEALRRRRPRMLRDRPCRPRFRLAGRRNERWRVRELRRRYPA